jgi:AbrB family looped-hinge helix DNA binding protein
MRYAAKVTSKGQVTIPKDVRDRFALAAGDYLVFKVNEERIEVTRAPVSPTEDFDGLADRIAAHFSERGITPNEVAEAIRWARQAEDEAGS